jgi:hypothetical protein
VGARLEADSEQAVAIGWHAEAFARTKRMKPLPEYLKPPPSPERQREQGARDVKRMFDRMIKKQEARHGNPG